MRLSDTNTSTNRASSGQDVGKEPDELSATGVNAQSQLFFQIPTEGISTELEHLVNRPYTVVIVDDSETDRAVYQRYMSKASAFSCSVLEGDSGEIGLSLCREHLPDLILLDYMLPDLDGLAFLQRLKQQLSPLPPVIMLTGEGNEKIAVEAMKVGVRDYLVKGDLTADRFVQAIQRVLSQQALEQLVSRQQRQQQLTATIAMRVSKAADLDDILQMATEGIRQLLDCDRAAIYQFSPDFSGQIVSESVLPNWPVSLHAQIEDDCFKSGHQKPAVPLGKYLDGYKSIIPDVANSSLSPCHIKMLQSFGIKSNLVVPIVLSTSTATLAPASKNPEKKQVWGLLLAHQCRNTREWRSDELTLLDDLSVQLAIALQQAEFVSALQTRAKDLAKTNRKLTTTTKLLKARNKELDEFAYIASHDLKAPLRGIENLASWLEEDLADKIPAENCEQLQLIQTRANRLNNFIVGLLDYSRAGRQSLEKESVDIHSLLSEILDVLSPAPPFEVHWPSPMPVISSYRLLLQQVFTNLIGNAIKYHDRPDGRVQIEIVDQGESIAFSVTDDGPGIDEAYHDKIFGVFQTLSSRDDVESTGIGLSIVKKIIEQQNGTITLRSAPGQGSTFTFTWNKE